MNTLSELVLQMFHVVPMELCAGIYTFVTLQIWPSLVFFRSKSITMIINMGTPDEESLTLVRGKRVETSRNSAFTARFAGLFVFIDTKIGVTLQWDKGTYLALKVTGEHSGKVEGLCGNYDQNSKNDFKTSGGWSYIYRL